ncbi:hypothetical protein GCM10011494_03790 [Novosphingobium endophyticum]|uniref:Uncharacterized protein n=1 Tax=Novosphingobium endophyticum TaxID=1955250 RepID=A0A916TPT5_9SPHN|nr:hypothetical protein GCM10011494_03790 [Novosphingobium endophyticum]
MHEHIIAALIALDEAEPLGCVEELDGTATLANDLGGHSATATAAAARAAAEAATAGPRTTAEAAATIAAATAAAETVTTATKSVATATETILSGEERIEIVLSSEPIPLVASPSATTSVKTHVYERTFDAPLKHSP